MAYIGNEALQSSEIRKTGPTTASGGETSVTLSFTSPSAQACLFFLNGVKQATSSYSVSGTTLTLAGGATLTASDVWEAIGITDIGTSITVAPNSIGINELGATGTASSSTYLNGSMVWSTITTPTAGDITTANNFFQNWNTIDTNTTSTFATTINAAIIGPITVTGSNVWTVSGILNIL
jgi:hypothetical protein